MSKSKDKSKKARKRYNIIECEMNKFLLPKLAKS